MSDLQKRLDLLVSFFPGWSGQPLEWSRVLIVEDTNSEFRRGRRIPRAALYTPEEYAPRFDHHLDAGYPWINMNAGGVLDGVLLVFIELPSYTSTVPRDKVSVNFSGPPLVDILDRKMQWDATGHIEIVD